jgi:hypothetical protein
MLYLQLMHGLELDDLLLLLIVLLYRALQLEAQRRVLGRLLQHHDGRLHEVVLIDEHALPLGSVELLPLVEGRYLLNRLSVGACTESNRSDRTIIGRDEGRRRYRSAMPSIYLPIVHPLWLLHGRTFFKVER